METPGEKIWTEGTDIRTGQERIEEIDHTEIGMKIDVGTETETQGKISTGTAIDIGTDRGTDTGRTGTEGNRELLLATCLPTMDFLSSYVC